MKKEKKQLNQQRQDFLLTFFNKDEYTEKEVNGFYLIKQFNGELKNWQVAIYSKESYKNKLFKKLNL